MARLLSDQNLYRVIALARARTADVLSFIIDRSESLLILD